MIRKIINKHLLTFLITPLTAWFFMIVVAMFIGKKEGDFFDEYLVILAINYVFCTIWLVSDYRKERRRQISNKEREYVEILHDLAER